MTKPTSALSDSGIEVFSAAVFAKPDPFVVEAYSQFDKEPLQFLSSSDLSLYIRKKLSAARGSAFLFVPAGLAAMMQ